MTCGPAKATFRLLDAYVGWDDAGVTGLEGLDDPAGLRLETIGGRPSRQELLPWFPDPRLAPGCRDGSWFLATSSTVLRRDGVGCPWLPVWPPHCAPSGRPAAVATAGRWLAVANRHGPVRVFWREGETVVTEVSGPARVLALTRRGDLYVARDGTTDIRRYRAGGTDFDVIRTGVTGRIDGLRVGRDRRLWILTTGGNGPRIWVDGRAATLAELADAFPPSTLASTWDGGFCLGGECFDWDGAPLDGPPPSATGLQVRGRLDTAAIDSGLSRCRWHRVALDADVPAGTAIRVAVAAGEDRGAVPEPGDWHEAPAGALDFLVDQPPGRYLFLRLWLTGDGTATPVVRRVRLDFPRATSAELLPAAFRADPAADDFTERFMSLFDATLDGIDRVIERYPALLDVRGVPDAALPWLGGLLGLAFEGGWSADTRRELLAAAPELYRRRGTPGALREVVRIVAGVEPVVTELATERAWLRLGAGAGAGSCGCAGAGSGGRDGACSRGGDGACFGRGDGACSCGCGGRGRERGDGRLGSVRLFGRSAARFRVGTSGLSGAPVRGGGDPHTDPLAAHAYRFRVALPPHAPTTVDDAALRRLVDAQAPAHTAGTVHRGGLGWVVGVWSAVGVDTAFTALPAPVLGPVDGGAAGRGRPVRLGRSSVVATSRRGPHRAMAVGERATLGVDSVSW
ncbi:phage tail protein [Phytohabitans sp. LJ34]|uniref:phage tail protein n=1 Tax=Phytohabitans sp. LJ34 TaxID=3452217 RepID=UPI003F8BA465